MNDEPYRDDVREALARAGWHENADGAVIAPNGALWAETNAALDSGIDAPDRSWSVAFDSGLPATAIVAAALAAGQQENDVAGKDTRKGESTLSSDVLDFITAVRDALTVPHAAPGADFTETMERRQRRDELIADRATTVRIAANVAIDLAPAGVLGYLTQTIRDGIDAAPVDYEVRQDEQDEAAR